jgi:hypothetical protein
METNRSDEPRARVFISCGQSKGTAEEQTASAVAHTLQELGFDPYIGVQEQTLRGLKENIFGQLTKSEYFVFIDFKREQLANFQPPVHRGSLFSHQELALASYLEIDVLALQESGVKIGDGILQFLQANATEFADRKSLPRVIADKIQERGWNPHWRNEIALERKPRQFADAPRWESRGGHRRDLTGRFFQIDVRNRHRTRMATNCYVYLMKAINLETSEEIPLQMVEFKWAGSVVPHAQILPGAARQFDAFWIDHAYPTTLQFNPYCDANDFTPRVQTEGRYELSFVVVSDNFSPSRGSFTLSLNRSLELTTFETTPGF